MSAPVSYQKLALADTKTGSTVSIFYREAGPKDAPVVLLLHGFPSSSHQYRGLMDRLSNKYRVIAPDYPGFGFSDAPEASSFGYTFDHLAEVIGSFTDALNLTRYALYVFDYGAPVGFRLALAHPERVAAIVSQNGNTYEEGLSAGWDPIRAYWENATEENRSNLRAFLQADTTRFQYQHGEPDLTRSTSTSSIAPAATGSSSTFSETTRTTLQPTRRSRSTSERTSLHCSPCGERTILSFYPTVRKPSGAIFLKQKFTSSKRVTLRWKHTSRRSPGSSRPSWLAPWM